MGLKQDFYKMILPMQPIMGKRVWSASICSCGREIYLEELEPGLGMYQFSHLCRDEKLEKQIREDIAIAVSNEVHNQVLSELWEMAGGRWKY